MLIAVDVDGVVANLLERWLGLYNKDFNDTLKPSDIVRWGVDEFVKPECGESIFQYLNWPTIYDGVQPVEGAPEGIDTLRDNGHRVVYVTAGLEAGKLDWLKTNNFLTSIREYIVCLDKSLVRADILIDDGPHNLKTFQGGRILYSQPWNRHEHPENTYRAHTWEDVNQLVNNWGYDGL